MKRLAIVGAGAAGLVAAIFAARAGAEVVVYEKNDAAGRKVLITGGGRCNVTNLRPRSEWPARFGKRGRFIVPALTFFPRERLEEFFRELGEPLAVTDGFHLFPASQSAKRIRDALYCEAEKQGVVFRLGHQVKEVRVVPAPGRQLLVDDDVFAAVVLACGGKSYPGTGSSWDGALLAAALGHRITRPVPALVGLRAENLEPGLAGIVLPDAEIRFRVKGKQTLCGRGELLLTHNGVSGPAVLDLSGAVAEELADASGRDVVLTVAWLGDWGDAEWKARFARWRENRGAATMDALLKEFLPARLARWLADAAGACVPIAKMTTEEGRRLGELLSAFPVRVSGTEGWERAIVTRGGVDVRDVDPARLESRLVPGLYLAGEMLDMDGPCGGYNLHWAFAGGALAGTMAAG